MATRVKAVGQGKVLGMMRANGGWLAVVQGFANRPGGVVFAELRDPATLKGSPRRKASRWLVELGAQPLP